MHVKICGVTSVADAEMCVAVGASAIGLNFVPTSPRVVDVVTARAISDHVGSRALVVGVVADDGQGSVAERTAALRALVRDAGLGCLQLHGDEPPALVEALLPHAYKAIRIGGPDDVVRAHAFPGEHILVDARVPGALGGTGAVFDWSLVRGLAVERKLTLAGGLGPHNVADAIRIVAPYCVDVASGVEMRPGVKDRALVEAFVRAARQP